VSRNHPYILIAVMVLLLLIFNPNYSLAQIRENEEGKDESPTSTQLKAELGRHGIPPPPPAVPESINITKYNKVSQGLIDNIVNIMGHQGLK